MSITKS